jgi:sn-glycerol 3-phosphate transport system ATP-binding protein
MAEVRVEGITKAWGAAVAVEDISFSAPAGHLVALLGTFGLRQVDDLAADRRAGDRERRHDHHRGPRGHRAAAGQRGVSMVFQNYALFPASLGRGEHPVRPQGARRAEGGARARLSRAAGILGLEALLERKPSQLSGGQQQRVALGRAIVAQTQVCLMDEPLSNLDAQLRVEMRREIRACSAASA